MKKSKSKPTVNISSVERKGGRPGRISISVDANNPLTRKLRDRIHMLCMVDGFPVHAVNYSAKWKPPR